MPLTLFGDRIVGDAGRVREPVRQGGGGWVVRHRVDLPLTDALRTASSGDTGVKNTSLTGRRVIVENLHETLLARDRIMNQARDA